jgi:hypothetical protein
MPVSADLYEDLEMMKVGIPQAHELYFGLQGSQRKAFSQEVRLLARSLVHGEKK